MDPEESLADTLKKYTHLSWDVSTPEQVRDDITNAIDRLKQDNIPRLGQAQYEELLIAREWMRQDPLCNDEFIEIGDGFFTIKVAKKIAWWNQYWCERTGEPPESLSWGEHLVTPGRYRVYRITEEWFMCRLEAGA